MFSCSVLSDFLWPRGLQHARLPCPLSPRVYSNSCPLSQWCHPTISSSVSPFSSCLQSFPASVFSSDSALHIRWSNYCCSFSFSISLSNEYSGLISFRIGWFDLTVKESLNRLQHISKASILWRSAFFVVQLSHLYMTMGKNIDLTIQTFVNKVIALRFNTLSRFVIDSVQFTSVAQSCPTLRDPMNGSTPGLPVHHQLPEFTQTHIHRVGDAIQPSHPLSCPFPPAPNPSQHQSLFQWLH